MSSYTLDNLLPVLTEYYPDFSTQPDISLKDLSVKNPELSIFLINNIKSIIENFNIRLVDNLSVLDIKDVSTRLLNKFISVEGRVTRTSAIYPEMVTCVYVCRLCKSRSKELNIGACRKCPNHLCTNRRDFDILPSKFKDFQLINIQEVETVDGHLPRSLEIKCYNENTEKVRPGEIVIFNGYILIEKINNKRLYKSAKQIVDEQLKIVFLCHSLNKRKMSTIDLSNVLNKILNYTDLYNNLSNMLFPSIYGHRNIKNAILLQLIGGYSTKRKNINILLLGDPGTSKSQFLKQISTSNINQNIVYTTGKTSSGVGLTAAVIKSDNESIVEAGALTLSDQGICCIDEFDKLSPQDITSLHEAMEQQTVTINKAGINVTLNARSSVLAAANPRNGRYDTSKSLRFNTNLSDTIMSRFDLFYIIVDEPDERGDRNVAQRVISNHLNLIDLSHAKDDDAERSKNEQGNNDTDENKNYTDQNQNESTKNNNNSIEEGGDQYNHEQITNLENDSASNQDIADMHKNMNENLNQESKNKNIKYSDNLPYLSKEEILSYINHVRPHRPRILPESRDLLIRRYKQLRLRNTTNSKNYLVSVRTLESLIRLSEALAKLYQSDVLPEYIEEAYRLITGSMIEIKFSDIKVNQKIMNKTEIDKILNTFIYILKTKERLIEDDLILYYVESVMEKLSDEQQLIAEQNTAKDVLNYLKEEGVLYDNDGFIYVHPDYDA